MDIIILAVIGAFLLKKLYDILGSEDGFIQNSCTTSACGLKDVEQTLQPINNDEDLDLIKSFSEEFISILNEIKRSDPNFTLKRLIEQVKEVAKNIIGAISDGSLESIKPLTSNEMFENLEIVAKSLNNKISIVSFSGVEVFSIQKTDNFYCIEFDMKMLQHLLGKEGKVSLLDVSERWTFQKSRINKASGWFLDYISDNNK